MTRAGRVAALALVIVATAGAARPKPPVEQDKETVQQAPAPPVLSPDSRTSLAFRFVAGISVKEILGFLAESSGINVIFESTFAPADTSSAIELEGVTLAQALNLVLTSNNLFYTALDSRTIMVVPDTPQNRQKYEVQVVRTFHLSHTDATEMATLLNGVLVGQGPQQIRPQIQANKAANSITIRGSAAIAAIAERVIDNNDRPQAEVRIDVEILEVDRARAKSYGLYLSTFLIGLRYAPDSGVIPSPESSGSLGLNAVVDGITAADLLATVPSAMVKFLESDSHTRLIAKPSLRGAEGTKLTAHLGDQIPVPLTTYQSVASGGTAANPMVSFEYMPVGINIAVTPRVTDDEDIVLDLELESSTKAGDVNVAGQNLPSFGTRKVQATMRLRDGESSLLAGLIRDDDRSGRAGVLGSIRVPVIRQLFSANESQTLQTDMVMLVTPHIIRTRALTERNLQPIFIGTAQNPTLDGGLAPIAPAEGTAPAEAVITTPGPDWRVGQGPYTITLSAANAAGVSTINVTLTYNPAVLRLRSVQQGSFVGAGAPGSAFAYREDDAAGRVDITLSRSKDTADATERGILAAVAFDAVAASEVTFGVSGVATGPAGSVPLRCTPVTVMVR